MYKRQGLNSVKAGVFRRAPAFHGLYPKSKPPAMRVVLIWVMIAVRLHSRLRYCVDDLSISGFDLTICATSVIIYRRAKSAKPVGM